MESKKINQLATELTPALDDLTIIGDPTTGISKKITLSQMASLFTGTVEEYANLAAFPLVGVADTIYIALDTNVLYRWNTGTNAYVELSPNIINSLVFSDANGFDGNISLVGSVATLTITTALTTGSVPFIGASGALSQDNANLFFDDTNNRLGINTNAPTTAIDVFGSGIIGRLNGTSTNNSFLGFASAGTNRWSIGNVQSDHRFRIYNEATTSELVSVLSTGEFGIGIANPTTKFHIDGAASALIANLDANVSVAKSVSFRSDNSNRINLEVSGTESGSNAGANFFIRRYSDAGALIDTPLTITRSTGVIDFSNSITIGGNSTLSKNQNDVTKFTISNTTAGSASAVEATFVSDATSGISAIGKFSSTSTGFQIINPNSFYLYNATNGDIAILNDYASGSIKMAAGGAINSHLTIASTGIISLANKLIGTSAEFISSGTTFVNVDSTINTGYSTFNHSENGVAKAFWEYINSNFADTSRRNYLEAFNNVGSFAVWTNSIKALDINTSQAATFTSSVAATKVILSGGSNQSELTNSVNNDFKLTNSGTFRIVNNANTIALFGITNAGIASFYDKVVINAASTTYGMLNVKQTSSQLYGAINVYSNNGTETFLGIGNNGSEVGFEATYGASGQFTPIVFRTSADERMRITSGGQVLIGKTTVGVDDDNGFRFDLNGVIFTSISAGENTYYLRDITNSVYRFYVTSGGTINATNTTISAISDVRLKENIVDLEIGLDAIMALRPRQFDWKKESGNDGKNVRGFIAQEFEEVFPDLIDESINKTPEGEPYKQIRQDLIPILVKAIQELKAEIEILKVK